MSALPWSAGSSMKSRRTNSDATPQHKTAMPAVDTNTSLSDGGHNSDVSSAGGGVSSISPSPAPAPEMTALQERLAESERARQLQANQLAEMQAAQRRQQQEIDPQKQRFLTTILRRVSRWIDLAKLHRSALVAGLPDNSR